MRLRDCTTQGERVTLALDTPAEVIKARLVAFLGWPTNGGAQLFHEWGEVVEELLDDGGPRSGGHAMVASCKNQPSGASSTTTTSSPPSM